MNKAIVASLLFLLSCGDLQISMRTGEVTPPRAGCHSIDSVLFGGHRWHYQGKSGPWPVAGLPKCERYMLTYTCMNSGCYTTHTVSEYKGDCGNRQKDVNDNCIYVDMD